MTQNEILCPPHCTEKVFSVAGEGETFSFRNDHKTFTNAHFVLCLKSGFSSRNSLSQLQNLLAQKHSHSSYHLNNILDRNFHQNSKYCSKN